MTSPISSFTKIMVKDLAISEPFYCEVMGLDVRERTYTSEGEYADEVIYLAPTQSSAPAQVMLGQYVNRAPPPAGSVWVGFVVEDVAAAVARALRMGGQIIIPTYDATEQKVRVAVILDPDGQVLELVEML